MNLTKRQAKTVATRYMSQKVKSGTKGSYIQLTHRVGVKVIDRPCMSKRRLLNSDTYQDLLIEVENQNLAHSIGVAPKVYDYGVIEIDALWYCFIKMEHAGRTICRTECYCGNEEHSILTQNLEHEFNEKLSQVGLSHMDIHPANICIKKERYILIDFGPGVQRYLNFDAMHQKSQNRAKVGA